MKKVIILTVALSGFILTVIANVAHAQGSYASISAEAAYRTPTSDFEGKSYPTIAEWAADGYQATVSAESRGNDDDNADNVGKGEAFFSQQPSGLSVAKGYGFGGARHSTYPADISVRTQITTNYQLHVVGEFDPLSPFVLKAFLPVHGVFGAFDFTHEPASAIASAFTGVRVRDGGTYDETHGGTVTIRSLDHNYDPNTTPFSVEATGDFVNSVNIRTDLANPEGFDWHDHTAELSQLLVYNLPLLVQPLTQTVDQFFEITFIQEIDITVTGASFKYAYADLRNTSSFEVFAADPNTGERIDGVINVEIVGAGTSAAAPEPTSLAILAIALPFVVLRIVRRRTSPSV